LFLRLVIGKNIFWFSFSLAKFFFDKKFHKTFVIGKIFSPITKTKVVIFFSKNKNKKKSPRRNYFFSSQHFLLIDQNWILSTFYENRQNTRFCKNSKNDEFRENQDPQKVLQLDIQLAVKPADLYIV
jgi:hypothetical protein